MSSEISDWPSEARAGVAPYAGPQCYPQLQDPVRYLSGGEFEQGRKKEQRSQAHAEVIAATGLPPFMAPVVHDQLSQCWLKCSKCGVLRLVDKWCMPALSPTAYGSMAVEGDPYKWRAWLCDARQRYSRWNEGRSRCAPTAMDEGAPAVESDGSVDSDEAVFKAGCAAGDAAVLPRDVLQGFGSQQPREMDGNSLTVS